MVELTIKEDEKRNYDVSTATDSTIFVILILILKMLLSDFKQKLFTTINYKQFYMGNINFQFFTNTWGVSILNYK